jgi:tripartite-type tricarboxylate transporter receptor subunit TctC
VLQALQAPDVVSRIQALGQTLSPQGPEDFGRFIRTEHERWMKVVKDSGAKAE